MPLRKFELLSLVGLKKHHDEPLPPSITTTSSSSSSRPSYQSSGSNSLFHRSSASSSSLPPPPPPPPPSSTRDGFYSSVQYERLTPSVNQRPPVLGGSSASSSASSRSASFQSGHIPSGVQYERLTSSSSARLPSPPVQYTPPSVRLPSPQYDRLTPTTSPAGGATLLNHHSPAPNVSGASPLTIPPLNVARSASFPSPTVPSPVDIAPLRTDSLRRGGKPQRGSSALASVAENGSPDVAMNQAGAAGTTTPSSGSDKSTPFSMVMEEWMSQLRTPTPDVMLLPSPFDFTKGTPTPVEKMEDIRHIHEALLPTPPPDCHDQRQGTKNQEYVLSSASGTTRRPLVEDIASLCRDLITQEVSEQIAKRLIKMGAFPPSGLYQNGNGSTATVHGKTSGHNSSRMAASENGDGDDDDDQFDDTGSLNGGTSGTNGNGNGGSSGSGKGKRRKMCTNEGCQNLSRSRGLCKAHGGGRRCSVEGCSRASQSGSLCITHGGGKRCTVDGCHKAAQSRGMCKAHGGGVRCRVDGCTKSSQGDGFCRTHGGGRRCGHPAGCQKWAQRNGMCMAHSEGRYGNSYRGRVARLVGDDNDGDDMDYVGVGDAAHALVKAANTLV